MIQVAKAFAIAAHSAIGQKRKYTGESYWWHAREVAALVATVTADEDMICAAWLHDVLEDTGATIVDLQDAGFNLRTITIVMGLTDVYTPEAYPHLNRKARKEYERHRLAYERQSVQTIKCADLIDNTRTITKFDPDFAAVYLAEKRALLDVMTKANWVLLQKAREYAEA